MISKTHPSVETLETRRLFTSAVLQPGGTLLIEGNSNDDVITVDLKKKNGQESVRVVNSRRGNKEEFFFKRSSVRRLAIATFGGADHVKISSSMTVTARIDGGADDDFLVGGKRNDTIAGGDGNDKLFGKDGNDNLDGGPGDDRLDAGNGNDTLTGGPGRDRFYGDSANDNFFTGDGERDTIDGGTGIDRVVTSDPIDIVRRCEIAG
jgi:Ca2+-binding RTX toxin-like protein